MIKAGLHTHKGADAQWQDARITGCRQRAFGDCTGLIMGCLGGESKAGKRMDLGDLERNNCGKIERDKGIKRTDLLLTGPLRTLVWQHPAPRRHSLSYFLINFHFCFAGWGILISLWICVYGGLQCQRLERLEWVNLSLSSWSCALDRAQGLVSLGCQHLGWVRVELPADFKRHLNTSWSQAPPLISPCCCKILFGPAYLYGEERELYTFTCLLLR